MKPNSPKYQSKPGFKVPDDYFSSLEDKLMRRIDAENKADLPDMGSGFTVPEGYFDTLEEQILSKTNRPSKVVSLFKKEYLYYAAAIAAIFVLMLGNFFQAEQPQNLGWDDVEITEIEDYFDEDYNMSYMEWNTTEYSDLMFDDARLIYEEDFNNVDSEAVFDYLDENIEDPTYIFE
ncbi:hypothetical protein GCM10023115_50010 [Pontixanthobacter gangjinensis]|uniref:Uncharacterized protein n=1 Tax=Christiangramia aestuarii TaxID=1028746 RepID=A0A7K1LP58_9FLAO|nr:hypothetical protein [Christiangramia aestuarii]MUP42582.1 hypothetical protein [Christiangramia aestuarii]